MEKSALLKVTMSIPKELEEKVKNLAAGYGTSQAKFIALVLQSFTSLDIKRFWEFEAATKALGINMKDFINNAIDNELEARKP